MAHALVMNPHHLKGEVSSAASPQPVGAGKGTLDLLFSSKVYEPESVLSGWLNLSFFSITTALLFYHMTRVKSIEMDGRVAGVFAIILMVVSICYTIFAMGPYARRIRFVIEQCLINDECSNSKAHRLRWVYYQYIALGAITSIIEICITYIIGMKTWDLILGKIASA